jgi:hypothetical protein
MITTLTLTAYGVPASAKGINRRLPTGRSWNGEIMKAVLEGVDLEFSRYKLETKDVAEIENILFNDNLAAWQNTLGLIAEGTVQEQEDDVVRKLRDVGGLRAQDIEDELRAAGFDVYVHENRLTGTTAPFVLGNPGSYLGNASLTAPQINTYAEDPNNYMFIPTPFALGQANSYLGNASLNTLNAPSDIIVNYILSSQDEQYRAAIENSTTQEEWAYTFIVGGATKGSYATVDADRKSEFRRVLLELKPASMWGILQIYYV